MNICFYIYTLNIGGAENIVVQYLQKLKEKGHNVFLIENYRTDSFFSNRIKDLNIPVYYLSKHNKNDFISKAIYRFGLLQSQKIINSVIAKEKIDIIHFHGYAPRMDKLSFPCYKMFYSFHSEFKRNIKNLGKKHVNDLKSLADRGMNFAILNREELDEIKQFFDTNNIFLLPNGIDFDKLSTCNVGKAYIKNFPGLKIDDYLVGHVGRFHKVKNHEKIVDIFHEILKQHSNAKLVLVGGDVDNRMEYIRDLCISKGIENRVYFLGNRSDVSEIISMFDLFIFPSYSECFPLSVLEAQYFGIPCVISDVITDEVVCNTNCIKININVDSRIWAIEGLKLVPQDPSNTLLRFDLKNIIERLIIIYDKCIKGIESESI